MLSRQRSVIAPSPRPPRAELFGARVARYRVTVLGENVKTLRGEALRFRVTRTIDAPDPLIAGERALSVVRADRELRRSDFDPWHPPTLEVEEVTEVASDVPPLNSQFEWE